MTDDGAGVPDTDPRHLDPAGDLADLVDPGDESDSYRYKTRTYLRRRLEKVERDIEVLEEHDPGLLDELRDVVCEDGESERED